MLDLTPYLAVDTLAQEEARSAEGPAPVTRAAAHYSLAGVIVHAGSADAGDTLRDGSC
jgi:hypothetical protein